MNTRAVIVFDIGSTLIHPNYIALKEWLKDRTHSVINIELLHRAFQLAICSDLYSNSSNKSSQAIEFFTQCGIHSTLGSNLIKSIWAEIVESGGINSWLYTILDPEAEKTLSKLKSLGCYLIAGSNSNGTLLEELTLFKISHFFDEIHDSKIIGKEKPDPLFYKEILKSAPKAHLIHVGDDLLNDCIAASNCGFNQTYLYDPINLYPGLPEYVKIKKLYDLVHKINKLYD